MHLRLLLSAAAALLLVTGCCGSDAPPSEAAPQPSAAAAKAAPAAPKAPGAPAALSSSKSQGTDAGLLSALSNALRKHGTTKADLLTLGKEPGALWAVTAASKDDTESVVSLRILRVGPSESAELLLSAPRATQAGPGNEDARFEEKAKLTVRDLDGDGQGEGLLLVHWTRPVQTRPGGACEGGNCFVETMETVQQLHVLTLRGGALAEVATHLVEYSSQSSASEEIDDVPDAETVHYDWKVADGPPARIALERTAFTVAPKRLPGLLDLRKDPLVSAGARGDLALPLAAHE